MLTLDGRFETEGSRTGSASRSSWGTDSPNVAVRLPIFWEFFGLGSPEKMQAMQAKVQKKIAVCMRKEGSPMSRLPRRKRSVVLNLAKSWSGNAPSKFDEKKFAELRKVEFALAVDDADCSAKTSKIR